MDPFLTSDKRRFYPHAKICRLCGCQQGPFLNLYGNDNNLLSKMTILPIVIDEFDCLPHKICYICSAKLSEFKDFIAKCTQTQIVLCAAIGRTPVDKSDNPKAASDDDRTDQKGQRVSLSRLAAPGSDAERPKKSHDDSVEVITSSDESDASSASSTPVDFAKLKVAGFETVYTCKGCSSVLIKKQLHAHKCPNRNKKEKPPAVDPRESSPIVSESKKRPLDRASAESNDSRIKRERTDRSGTATEPSPGKKIIPQSQSCVDVKSENAKVNILKAQVTMKSCLTKKAVAEHLARMGENLGYMFIESSYSIRTD